MPPNQLSRTKRWTWYFADGYLPAKNPASGLESHEALMLLNTRLKPVAVSLDVFYQDREPDRDIHVQVPPERVIALRLDHPDELGGVVIPPLTQYALKVTSDQPIIAVFGRLDATQPNLAYYAPAGIREFE